MSVKIKVCFSLEIVVGAAFFSSIDCNQQIGMRCNKNPFFDSFFPNCYSLDRIAEI